MKKLIYILLTVLLISCDGFTEVDLPNSQLTAPAVFENEATAAAAMTEIYTKMRESSVLSGTLTGTSHQLGLYADELEFHGGPGSLSFSFAQNALQPAGTEIQELWNSSYTQIYGANAVIEGLSRSTAISTEKKNHLTGEALLVRGLVHFYLACLFGDVPYVPSTDYQSNRTVSRSSYDTVLEKAAGDMADAAALLPVGYAAIDRTRPNKFAALAFLSRIRLYQEDWAGATAAASEVIAQTGTYTWITDLEQAYLKEAPSTIWQFAPGMQGNNTLEATTFSFQSGPPPLSALSSDLMASFEQDDLRKANWTRQVTSGAGSWSHIYKYKQAENTGTSSEYSIIIALPELYLIRAESQMMLGNADAALEDVNRIRLRAGLPIIAAASTDQLLAAIMQERRIELACEFGHRFFDLKRLGWLDAVLGPNKPGWSSTDRLLPLPEREIILNPKLAPQNDGY